MRYTTVLLVFLGGAASAPGSAGHAAIRRLAAELAEEGSYQAAAIEYRRLGLSETVAERQGGYYWAAAYAYWRNAEYGLAARMLDRAEDCSDGIRLACLLLRAETAVSGKHPEEAAFYLRDIAKDAAASPEVRALVTRRQARICLLRGDTAGARELLSDDPKAIAALDSYAAARDKSPLVGGLLGLVPGLGFVYCGEYDNALRSLLLNGLFIYAMTDTAGDGQWGAFAAVSFFELTWYTGSVYGGVDAVHRHNRQRLDGCLDSIDGKAGFTPDLPRIPVVSLQFRF